jgi:TraM recognition site of TraD and TraG
MSKRPKPVKVVCLPGDKPEILIPIEGELDLVTHIDFKVNGRAFGAYLLKIAERKYRLVFGFDCDGIHPNLAWETVDPICNRLKSGFKDLPEGEILTIHMKSFVDNTARIAELSKTVENCNHSDVLKYIMMTEQRRVMTLTEKGMRKPKSLRLFATFTFDPEADVKDDKIEAFTKGIYKVFTKFSGAEKGILAREFTDCLEAAVTSFYLWEQILGNKMGLGVRALSADELWGDLWGRVNSSPPPPIPQRIVFNGKVAKEQIINQLHPLSILINEESSLPIADYRWVKVKNKYIGIMAMLNQPDRWEDNLDALNYVWNKLGDDSIYDIEVITQLQKVNQSISRKKLKDLTDEEVYKSSKSSAEGEINVAADLNAEEAIEAQEILHRGGVELKSSTTYLVHRHTVDELNRACDYLSSLFLYPAHIHREYTYSWITWLQTFAVAWDMCLTRPFKRDCSIFTDYVLGTVPLAAINSRDSGGFELLSNDGGVPIYIDIINKHHHILWISATRGGKSVGITGMLNGVLAHNIPVTIVDCPATKDASTFKDYTTLLGGAFFDVGSECSNIFEIPDLSQLAEIDREDREKDYQEFLLEILQILVVGSSPDLFDPMLRDLVRSLLLLAMTKFFAAREIQTRYIKAVEGGLGSEAWKKYPVLNDFIGFCSPERINVMEPEQLKALSFIVTKLRSWTQSRVGQAFCRPSTFKTDSLLFTMAIRGVANAEDMAVISTVAYGTALRRAYSHSKSVLFLDEAAVLLKFPSLSLAIGKLLAIAAKAGIRVMIAAQEINSIETSAGGKQILANCDIKLIGRLESAAVDDISEVLRIPLELLAPNLTASYEPNKGWGYSNWLLLDGQSYTWVRIYASSGTLAAVVNNVDEVKRRQVILDQADHPIVGLAQYASELLPI